jgi:hypothetical protein
MQQSSVTDPAVLGAETALGAKFAEALARKDWTAVLEVVDPDVDFQGLTPRSVWEASDAHTLVDGVLSQWFEDSDTIEEIASIETDSFADRQRVAYRFLGHNPDNRFVVEQQVYYTEKDGRINWMRVLCSGYRPV